MMHTFTCSNCGRQQVHRQPIRSGNNWEQLFCSFPCAWAYRKSEHDLDNLCKWLSLAEGHKSETFVVHLVRETLEAANRICIRRNY